MQFSDNLRRHKEIYWRLLNELDNDIYSRIIAVPHGEEARQLERRVEIILENEFKNALTAS